MNNLFPDFNGLKQEKLTNTDQLLTVIPLLKNNKQENSRILLLKIHNKIRSAIFTIYPEKDNSGSEFSGRVIISNLNGEFVNGFRVDNGYIISNFTKKNNNNSTYKTIDLEEVIIPVRLKASKANTAFIFPGDSPGSSLDDYTWNPDYLNGGGGNGGDTKPNDIAKDPCSAAKTTSVDAKSISYSSAKTSIIKASNDGLEHSITLGKDNNGQITQAPMNDGGAYNVPVNSTWPGAFAALHNHPNKTPLSAGDIYTSVKLNIKSGTFTTTYILTDGEVYGIVVTDLAAAKEFVATYPADQLPGQSPEFPDYILDQMLDLVNKMGSSNEGRTTAIAFVLDKHNSGITLLKQDSSGNFQSIKTQETTQANGTKTYTSIPCN
ncbi:hypothetical protein J3S90_04980 [Flavobacterium sp. P4023]|uniref:Uncharacterized protein n=1 Tax=Flavobacterium flabelliforme TaxID=2816119 RepID=A0ABS5CRA0_9FLAO|nr:hypothetical protein [Flavobacterium flabelliforme]MBP4141152.1 hypothetical protein [Flavobacterium flabelliforme]